MAFRLRTTSVLPLALSFALLPGVASGQSIRCILPVESATTTAACPSQVPADAERQLVIVQVLDAAGRPAPGVNVQIEADGGTLPQPGKSDEHGLVTVEWVNQGKLAGAVTLTLKATIASATTVKQVVISPQPAGRKAIVAKAGGEDGDGQYWFKGHTALKPLMVTLAVPASECGTTPAAFRAVAGGKVSPDTVFGRWDDGSKRCIASARWTFDDRVGPQHARVTSKADPVGVTFEGRARSLPRLFLGVNGGVQMSWNELTVGSGDTVTVTTKVSDSVTEVHKVIRGRSATIEPTGANWGLSPVVGIDFPLWYTNPKFRMSAAVAADNLRNEWFLGLSLLQSGVIHEPGYLQESLGIDVHLVLDIIKHDEATDPGGCLEDISKCDTSPKLKFGIGLLLVTDGAGVISSLAKALGFG